MLLFVIDQQGCIIITGHSDTNISANDVVSQSVGNELSLFLSKRSSQILFDYSIKLVPNKRFFPHDSSIQIT